MMGCFYLVDRALSHSCNKLGNRDFVFKSVERIEDSTW